MNFWIIVAIVYTKISQFISGSSKHAHGQDYDYFLPSLVNTRFDMDVPVLQTQLEKASLRLGELNAMIKMEINTMPDLSLLMSGFINNEAALSSSIEGTQTLMEDLFRKEESVQAEKRDDWLEVHLYTKALRESVDSLTTLPLCNRLLKQAHKTLLSSRRGQNKAPGEFRRSQNWIGGGSVRSANFVPPHHQHVEELMGDLEQFLNTNSGVPELIRIGIAHYQFETIHPFLDGNGRVGRMLIVLFLVGRGLLEVPLFYPSAFLEEYRDAYFDKLIRVRRENDLAGWLLFFLEAMERSAVLGQNALLKVWNLKNDLTQKIKDNCGSRAANTLRALDFAFGSPLFMAQNLQQALSLSPTTSYAVIAELVKLGVLQKETAQRRNQVFRFASYLDIFQQPVN